MLIVYDVSVKMTRIPHGNNIQNKNYIEFFTISLCFPLPSVGSIESEALNHNLVLMGIHGNSDPNTNISKGYTSGNIERHHRAQKRVANL